MKIVFLEANISLSARLEARLLVLDWVLASRVLISVLISVSRFELFSVLVWRHWSSAPVETSSTIIGLHVSADNDQQLNQRRRCFHDQQAAEMGCANNMPDTSRAVQVTSLPGLAAAAGSTVRRTLYSPRYASDGRLKHYLATTNNDILSSQ